jgi:hypothetical protein
MKQAEQLEWYRSMRRYLDLQRKDYPVAVGFVEIVGKSVLTIAIRKIIFPVPAQATLPIDGELFGNTPLGAITKGMSTDQQVAMVRGLVDSEVLDLATQLSYPNMFEAAQDMFQLTPQQVNAFITESSSNAAGALVSLLSALSSNGYVAPGVEMTSLMQEVAGSVFTDTNGLSQFLMSDQVVNSVGPAFQAARQSGAALLSQTVHTDAGKSVLSTITAMFANIQSASLEMAELNDPNLSSFLSKAAQRVVIAT